DLSTQFTRSGIEVFRNLHKEAGICATWQAGAQHAAPLQRHGARPGGRNLGSGCVRLGRGLRRKRLNTGWREFKATLPFAGDVAVGAFWRGKFPFVGCLQSKIGKKRAWPWVIELGARYIASSVHMEPDANSYDPVNRGERFVRNVRQHLI